MSKVRLELGAELDILNRDELSSSLSEASRWWREAAFGVRHIDFRMQGSTDGSGNLALGGDQADQQPTGPKEGWCWGIKRISVDGMASNESVKVYKELKFLCTIGVTTGFATFGDGGCLLSPGEYLRVTGSGMTHNEQITVTGEAVTAPMPMQWKIVK